MTEKPMLYVVPTKPILDISSEDLKRFKEAVLSGVLPSVALREFMKTYPTIDSNVVIDLFIYTYPGAYMTSEFRVPLHDTNYPQCQPDVYSDADLDKAVEELLKA